MNEDDVERNERILAGKKKYWVRLVAGMEIEVEAASKDEAEQLAMESARQDAPYWSVEETGEAS